MPRNTNPGENRVQPPAYPNLQSKKSTVRNVSTVRSGKVVGQKVDGVKV